MDRICKTCRFWKDRKNGFGDCIKVIFYYSKEKLENNEENGGAYVEFDVADDSGLWINFVTNENFGCVNWGEK